jgi:hypothetical protein
MTRWKTELEQQRPSPPYTRWDQRGKPVLLCYLKNPVDGKSLCLSLETDHPTIAKRHMRLLVTWSVAKGLLSADSGAAKVYGQNASRLTKVKTEVRRLKALSDAKFGSEAVAVAKRWRRPVGIIHHLAERKPALSAGTFATRRMRARERGQRTPMGHTWEHRAQGGKGFLWNHAVLTARVQINRQTWQWPLQVIDEKNAGALMAPVRIARERLRQAAAEELKCEFGTEGGLAATAARFSARADLASAIRKAGGPKKLVEFVLTGPQEGLRSVSPEPVANRRDQRRKIGKAAHDKCVQRYIELIHAYPDGAPEPRDVLVQKMRNDFGVSVREARNCRTEAIKRTGNLKWATGGRPSH